MQEMFTPEEVAEKLKISRRTVYLWLREGRIKGIKVGDLWRIPESALQEFLEEGNKTANQ
ncbi:MAG: DNA-binding protein [Peptococcaceae bacterium]|jgi:excisionase family DNA binding protein|nr:MAG: DNA-binding protein [Peptococcaceae bacterium]